MNIGTEEMLLKRRINDIAYKHPNIHFPSFRFSSSQVKMKRVLWQLVYSLIGIREYNFLVFCILKKILKKYVKQYDLVAEEVIKIIEMIYKNLKKPQIMELKKMFDDFLQLYKYDKEKKLMISLSKLKYQYLDRLNSPTSNEDIIYLQGLIYKKNYINHPRFHFLSIRFQASVRKYFGEESFETPPAFLQEYISKGSDVRFLRVYLKVLKASKRFYEAIFLIQNLLMEFEGSDECYYYSKQCLKFCKVTNSDIPDIFWKNFTLYYTKSKTICELLIEMYSKDSKIFADNTECFKQNLITVLLNAKATKKIWVFFEKKICKSKSNEFVEAQHVSQIMKFQTRALLEKIFSNSLDSFDIFIMQKLSNIAKVMSMQKEKAFFDAAVNRFKHISKK
jgi:hypothetical protein